MPGAELGTFWVVAGEELKLDPLPVRASFCVLGILCIVYSNKGCGPRALRIALLESSQSLIHSLHKATNSLERGEHEPPPRAPSHYRSIRRSSPPFVLTKYG
jgi:hypothetical protein